MAQVQHRHAALYSKRARYYDFRSFSLCSLICWGFLHSSRHLLIEFALLLPRLTRFRSAHFRFRTFRLRDVSAARFNLFFFLYQRKKHTQLRYLISMGREINFSAAGLTPFSLRSPYIYWPRYAYYLY